MRHRLRQILPSPAEALLRRGYEVAARGRQWARRGRPYPVEVLPGLRVTVHPEVFDPVLFRSGVVLARAVAAQARPGLRMLDLGCGTGASGLAAARAGAKVTCSDLNPHAVACAADNARALGLSVQAHQGDLFEGLETFDLISFNPPFFRGTPTEGFDQAWRGADVFERFAEALPAHLAPGGVALVLHSDHGACDELTALLHDRGLHREEALREELLTESMVVERWRAPSP